MHQLMAATLDRVVDDIRRIQLEARAHGFTARPRWPMIVLCTPKGWTGPKVVDGVTGRRTFRAHQVPLAEVRSNPAHLRQLEEWMRSYRAGELFDAGGKLRAELAELAPRGARRMGANPHANGGLLLHELRMPEFREYAVAVPSPGAVDAGDTTRARQVPARRDSSQRESAHVPPVRAGRDRLQPPHRRVRGDRAAMDRRADRRRRSPGPRGQRHGSAERAPVPGMARRLPAHRAARSVQLLRGVHPHHRLDVQPARQVAEGDAPDPLAAPHRLAELPVDLARLAAGSQRLHPPGSRLHRSRGEQEGRRDPRVPAARCQLPAVRRRPLPAQPPLRQRDRGRQAARAAVARHGGRGQALHGGHRHLGVGQH